MITDIATANQNDRYAKSRILHLLVLIDSVPARIKENPSIPARLSFFSLGGSRDSRI